MTTHMLMLIAIGSLVEITLSHSFGTPTESPSTPGGLVAQALKCEEQGNFAGRQVKLEEAVRLNPEDAPARWQLGETRLEGQWMSPEAVARHIAGRGGWAAYDEERKHTPDTADGHLKLARWCRTRLDRDAERGHLFAAAHLAPDDSRPRRLLGLKSYGGSWLTDREVFDATARRAEAARIYQEAKQKLLARAKDLASPDLGRREGAEQQIRQMRDPRTIPALEDALTGANKRLATVSVEAFGQMPERDATWALARQALWSPWNSVRNRAIDELRGRDPQTFMLDLIDLLTPCDWSPDKFVRLHDGSVARIQSAQNLGGPDVLVTRYALPQFDSFALNRGVQLLDAEAARVIDQIRVNQISSAANQRIQRAAFVLRLLTNEDFGSDQSRWRKWWADQNFLYESPTYQTNHGKPRYLLAEAPILGFFSSCLVAGTPVWTRRGPVAVDHIQVGDLVLSMNPESGELGYQPVLRRTIRPATKVRSISIDGEEVRATIGHPLWVSGKGWVLAKDLTAGNPIRLCGRVASIESINDAQDEIAYNLEVREFNTYFVGASKVLVHDNSPISHSYRTVPGL